MRLLLGDKYILIRLLHCINSFGGANEISTLKIFEGGIFLIWSLVYLTFRISIIQLLKKKKIP